MSVIAQEPDWLAWLRARAADLGNLQKVAEEVGISRTAVSLLLAGKYSANTDKVAAKITALACAGSIWCPHLRHALTEAECRSAHQSPMPQSDASALRHWLACKSCPNSGVPS